MSTPDPPPTTTTTNTTAQPPPQSSITHTAAIAAAILCPIALLLPTRGGGAGKRTLQNALLGGAAFWGFDRLAADYTGKSITARSGERWGSFFGISNNTKEEEVKEGGEKEKNAVGIMHNLPTERAARNKELMQAEKRRRAEAEGRVFDGGDGTKKGGLWERLWMGGEKEGWREKRLEEERKALESGKGYGGLIADQVREVWKGEDTKDGKGDGEGKKGE
ncbi:exocyst complex component SEC3 [Parachaetomium inaequale]|uniref:Exocyst complex component SEC3 n=1 Tax=Parachaetomium inaequale TaxID=2588326 RepID=A0AAN6SMG2_9PEZI|nr:exocyst complex component SEC3 [Parachaetomium inaequale]